MREPTNSYGKDHYRSMNFSDLIMEVVDKRAGDDIAKACNHDLATLQSMSLEQLTAIKGVGDVVARKIMCLSELVKRREIPKDSVYKQMRCSRDLYMNFRPFLECLQVEEFWVCVMNRANRVICNKRVSSGGVSGTVVDIKVLMNIAVRNLASSVALAHNHPSGNIRPSDADRHLTMKVKEACKLMDLHLLDHIIIAEGGYTSFADDGLMPT